MPNVTQVEPVAGGIEVLRRGRTILLVRWATFP